MQLRFTTLQFLNPRVDPFDSQAVEALGYEVPVMPDSRLQSSIKAEGGR
jgi:hypothetical protein